MGACCSRDASRPDDAPTIEILADELDADALARHEAALRDFLYPTYSGRTRRLRICWQHQNRFCYRYAVESMKVLNDGGSIFYLVRWANGQWCYETHLRLCDTPSTGACAWCLRSVDRTTFKLQGELRKRRLNIRLIADERGIWIRWSRQGYASEYFVVCDDDYADIMSGDDTSIPPPEEDGPLEVVDIYQTSNHAHV